MEEVGFNITPKEFKQLSKWAESTEEQELCKWNTLGNFSIDNNNKIPNLLGYEYRIV